MTLTCSGVTVAFKKNVVLSDIDLKVKPGEWLGLIGPNGAGKSTLLHAMAGLVEHGGTVRIVDFEKMVDPKNAVHLDDGESASRIPGATDLALVPQSPLLPQGMTVAEYVLLGRTAHLGWLSRESRTDRQIAASILYRLDLDAFAHRPILSLSGGEAQRVVVARALAQQAPILLLDEPTSALDVGHQLAVLELVDDLRNSDGLTVIAAMHDLTTAARFADRLALLDQGKLLAEGTPGSVLQPERLSKVYNTPLTVQTIDDELVVLARSRHHQPLAEQHSTNDS